MHRQHVREIGIRLIGAVQQSRFWSGRLSGVTVIMNPAAGMLMRHGMVRRLLADLVQAGVPAGAAVEYGIGSHNPEAELCLTEHPGHGCKLGRLFGQRLLTDAATVSRPRLLVTVGGDGTHEEVLSGLLDSGCNPAFVRVLRLPMGSGNDVADVANADEAVCVLRGETEESSIPVVQVELAGGEKIYAFNIASFGLDACVVEWSNRLKRSWLFPGDSYKLIADLVSLFYVPSFKKGGLQIDANSETIKGSIVLAAFGATGYRMYGHGKKVLPGSENVCIIQNMSIPKRIALKGQFYRGEHTRHSNTVMRSVSEAIVRFGSSIYFQADGESRVLQAADFPVRMRVLPTAMYHVSARPDCVQTQ